MLLITIAVGVGVPLAYMAGGMALEQFAYKIPISFTIIFSGVGIIALPGVLTIASQTWRAASVNPVNSLRYE